MILINASNFDLLNLYFLFYHHFLEKYTYIIFIYNITNTIYKGENRRHKKQKI